MGVLNIYPNMVYIIVLSICREYMKLVFHEEQLLNIYGDLKSFFLTKKMSRLFLTFLNYHEYIWINKSIDMCLWCICDGITFLVFSFGCLLFFIFTDCLRCMSKLMTTKKLTDQPLLLTDAPTNKPATKPPSNIPYASVTPTSGTPTKLPTFSPTVKPIQNLQQLNLQNHLQMYLH